MLFPSLRKKIRSGIGVSGCSICGFCPEQIEILGLLGFDFAFIDNEHWPFTDRELQTMITAGDAVGMPCLVRIYDNNAASIKHVMDSGAAGIIVPDCATPEIARKAIEAVKYAPAGKRGLSVTRAARYGLRGGLAEFVEYSNETSVIVCQIESPEGVSNAEEIAAIEDVDVLFIGTTDLSHAMGLTGKPSAPEVRAAVEQIKLAAQKQKCALGTMVRAGESPQDYISAGYVMHVGSGTGFFAGGAKKYLGMLSDCEK